jgi:hypothetical protein
MSTATEALEQTINTTAVRRLGVADTSIVRVDDKPTYRAPAPEEWYGVWFTLSVKLLGDVEWKLLGRRRTREELLTLVSSLDPRHVDGKSFVK